MQIVQKEGIILVYQALDELDGFHFTQMQFTFQLKINNK